MSIIQRNPGALNKRKAEKWYPGYSRGAYASLRRQKKQFVKTATLRDRIKPAGRQKSIRERFG